MRSLTLFPCLALCLLISGNVRAADYYVSTTGSSSGSGSISSPWDIVTGLVNKASAVRPGDTVWLRGGTYGSGGSTTIYSKLGGTSTLPVYIRQYPGERATINGGLGIAANYGWYWGFEIAVLNWNWGGRTTSESGSLPSGKPADAVFFSQGITGCKLINLIIHDAADGIADQQEAIGTEEYGNLSYNHGWTAPDRGHGHGIYLQNGSSVPKLIANNITYNSFDIGIQAYGTSAGPVAYLTLDGNVAFNAGLPAGHRVDNILFQGGGLEQAIKVSNGIFYNPLDADSSNTGYNEFDGTGVDLTLQNNYWIGATPTNYVSLQLRNWQSLVFTGNTVVGPLSLSNVSSNSWSGNAYYNSAPPSGTDSGSPVYNHNPTGLTTIVQPNKYEPGRAHIIVLNWNKSPSVSVNIAASGLKAGQQFEVRDSQNFWGTPVLSGTYDGSSSITLPMNLTQVSALVGGFTTPPHTSAEFNVFILLPKGTVAAPPVPANVPLIGLTTSSLAFSGAATGSAPSPQNITVTNSGAANTVLNWTATSNQSWLSAYPASGQLSTGASTTVGVSVITSGLAPGTYQGTLTISDPNAINNPQPISVSLTVTPPPPPAGTSFVTDQILGTLRNDFTGWVGMRFNVGASPLTVSYLARLNAPGNVRSHVVKLVYASSGLDVPGGSVTIAASTGSNGVFNYGALATPIVLAANTSYLLASQEIVNGDKWYDLDSSEQTTNAASIAQAEYYDTSWHGLASVGHTYGTLNFAYALGASVTPPPTTTPAGTAFVTGQRLGTLRNDFSGWVGFQFRVGATSLTLSGLGRIVAPGAGGTHTVKLVNAATGQDVPGGSAVVSTAGLSAGSYAYGTINSIVLSANTLYSLLSQETAGADYWYDFDTSIQSTSVASPYAAVYAYANLATYYLMGGAGLSYGPVNFLYQQGGASAAASSQAVFLKSDLATKGNWKGVYGIDGEAIASDLTQFPSYATVAFTGAQTYTWAASTPDVRALQKASNLADRLASTWYSTANFSVDVNLAAGTSHKVAFYMVDWDNSPRNQRVDVFDAATQTLLDSRIVSDFREGQYLVWNVQGHVNFRWTNLAPSNAVVSGIFFGAN